MMLVAHIWGNTPIQVSCERGKMSDVLRLQIGEPGGSSAGKKKRASGQVPAREEGENIILYLHEFGRRRFSKCLQDVLERLGAPQG